MGTVQGLAKAVEGELAGLMPDMYRNPRKKLAIMVACLVETRSCNTMELAAKLPFYKIPTHPYGAFHASCGGAAPSQL